MIEADATHYYSDVLMNLAVIASLALASRPGWAIVDPLIALMIACAILRPALRIGRRAYHNLMGRELEDADKEAILRVLQSAPRIEGFSALKTRRVGSRVCVQAQLAIDDSLSFLEAHAIAHEVEERLRNSITGADIILHQEPVSISPRS